MENSYLPSLAVTDIKKVQERVQYLQSTIVFLITRIKEAWVLGFEDSRRTIIRRLNR